MASRTKPRNKFKSKQTQSVKQIQNQKTVVNIINQKSKKSKSKRKSTPKEQQKPTQQPQIIQVPQYVPQYITQPAPLQNPVANQELVMKLDKINTMVGKLNAVDLTQKLESEKEAAEIKDQSKNAVDQRLHFGTIFNAQESNPEPEEGSSSSSIFAKLSSPFTAKKTSAKKTFPIELENDYQEALKSYKSAVSKIDGEKPEHGTRVRSEFGSFIEKGESKEAFNDYMLQKYHRQ